MDESASYMEVEVEVAVAAILLTMLWIALVVKCAVKTVVLSPTQQFYHHADHTIQVVLYPTIAAEEL